MGHKVTNDHLKIAPKRIGRHEGFILTVSCPTLSKPVKYFAKVQDAEIGTVLMHHLLKELHCGPEEFLVVNLTNPRYRSRMWDNQVEQHGVITREIDSFTMASALSFQELQAILSDRDQYQADMFLLTLSRLLIEFGQFANIPVNWDNWGFTKRVDAETNKVYYRLTVVDFSSERCRNTFLSENWLEIYWGGNILYLPKANYQKLPKEYFVVHVTSQLFRYDWLQSKELLVATLQRVCDATCDWIKQQSNTSLFSVESFLIPGYPAASKAGHPLTWQQDFLPRTRTRVDEDRVAQYHFWVREWNRMLELLFAWQVFPTKLNALDLLNLTKIVISPSFLVAPAAMTNGDGEGVRTRGQKRKAGVEKDEVEG